MRTAVYDTYYTSPSGKLLHFDVLVEHGVSQDDALQHARSWLNSIGETGDRLQQEKCNYCHSENAPEAIREEIENRGFYILQMEGCPDPVA